MELFTADGHLTDEGIKAVANGTLDELQRLEAAEHLSFCDRCLERYTAMLTDDSLLQPARPLVPPVLSRIRKRAVQLFFNKYTTVAAAAVLALTLWGTGVFQALVPAPRTKTPEPPRTTQTITAQVNSFLNDSGAAIAGAVNDIFIRAKSALKP